MRVAFVGLGTMGSRMAARLAGQHELVVWNRDTAKTQPLVELGATAAATPAEAARGAAVVITMVSNPDALRDVTEGPEGVAAGADASTTVIQMSTVGAPAIERLASALPAGAGLLDAPVLGSTQEAEAGELRIFAGGAPELVERWTPLLSQLGTVMRVGAVGAGSAAKLVANASLLGIVALLGEVVALADGLGLERDVAFDVLAASPLAAQAERRRAAIESDDYPARFALSLALKDESLVVAAAEATRTDLRLAQAARSWLADAVDAGLGEEDYTAVLAQILHRA